MRTSSFRLTLPWFGVVAAVVLAAPAAWASEPFRCAVPGGFLEVPVLQGWESNPRLAHDNGVLAFFNPPGMTAGAQVPFWVIVDRDSLKDGMTFEDRRREILLEGRGYGFVPTDSSQIRTADGPVVYAYNFKTDGDTLHHGLGILASPPRGVILLRYQAASEAVWMQKKADVVAILKGVRLVRS